MKISEIITDKYKLRIPPTVYYELLADVVEAEEEQESKWIPIKTRPLTDKEKEKYAYLGYSEEELDFMYDCLMPEDGEEVLITTRYDEVNTDTFYRDEGCYFESYCDKDDIKAWMPLPKPYEPQESELENPFNDSRFGG